MYYVQWISMFNYIFNIKMTLQSLSNFYIELRAIDSVKFDNDCYIILLLNTFLGDLATVI